MLLLCPIVARADIIQYQLNNVFGSGDPPPTGSSTNGGPWIDATFSDAGPNEVFFTVTNVGLVSGEFVKGMGSGANGGLFFNLNSSLNVTNLGFTLVSETGGFGTTIGQSSAPGYKADGDGYYNIQLDFSGGTFSVNSSFTYELTLTNGNLTASDFEQLSLPASGDTFGPYYAAAHIMGLANGDSTWIEPGSGYQILSVPEPVPAALLVASATLFFARTFRRRRP